MRRRYVKAMHRVVNAADVSARRRAPGVVRRAFTKRGRWARRPDVIHFSEVSSVNVARIAASYGYDVIQHGPTGDPAAGVALALRRDTVEHFPEPELRWASDAVRGQVRARPILTAMISVRGSELYDASATHAPPDRTPAEQDDYLDDYRDTPGVIGGDHNEHPGQMRGEFSRKYRGIGVLGLLVPRRFKASQARAVRVGSDHLGIDSVLRLPVRSR